jgi:hypothetical protein
MDQATLNQYFESGAGMLAHHADGVGGTNETGGGDDIVEVHINHFVFAHIQSSFNRFPRTVLSARLA